MRSGAKPDYGEQEKLSNNLEVSMEHYDQLYTDMLKRRENVIRLEKLLVSIIANLKSKFSFI
jgi:hypothetical protein